MSLHHPGVSTIPIVAIESAESVFEEDEVSVEEPLEIRLRLPGEPIQESRVISVTMRTPGSDVELAAGFLFTEGILHHRTDLTRIENESPNRVVAELASSEFVDLARLDRHSFMSSSCGVCGKRSIASVFTHREFANRPGEPPLEMQVIHELSGALRAAQNTFGRTGGLHASGLLTTSGELLACFEDVGRHNALDKLIGAEFLAGRLPLEDRLLLLSGRVSFELVQKATMAGIPIVAAVGAPSSLAISLAREARMTLCGFVRDGRFNVYADTGRLLRPTSDFFPTSTPSRLPAVVLPKSPPCGMAQRA
jgi:FdhD protein